LAYNKSVRFFRGQARSLFSLTRGAPEDEFKTGRNLQIAAGKEE
jgi:hypothetical protein